MLCGKVFFFLTYCWLVKYARVTHPTPRGRTTSQEVQWGGDTLVSCGKVCERLPGCNRQTHCIHKFPSGALSLGGGPKPLHRTPWYPFTVCTMARLSCRTYQPPFLVQLPLGRSEVSSVGGESMLFPSQGTARDVLNPSRQHHLPEPFRSRMGLNRPSSASSGAARLAPPPLAYSAPTVCLTS